MTIRQVAGLAGVSPATVSRVINGSSDVSDEMREAVLAVVREHGYSTGRHPGRSNGSSSGLIGVAVPMLHHSYFSEILAGASEACSEHGLGMVLSHTLHDHAREVGVLQHLRNGITDGALLVLPEESTHELELLSNHGYPIVIIDPHKLANDHIPTVAAAHETGAREAVEYLLSLGHRRIAAVGGTPGWTATEDRVRAYRGALNEAGITPDPDLQRQCDFDISSGVREGRKLLALAERPTAIFAFNDLVAIGVMQAARELGVRIPEDLSLVGYDDTVEASLVYPALTTVRQPLAEMGRMGVTQLCRLLGGRNMEALHVELATKLIVRESTGPAPR